MVTAESVLRFLHSILFAIVEKVTQSFVPKLSIQKFGFIFNCHPSVHKWHLSNTEMMHWFSCTVVEFFMVMSHKPGTSSPPASQCADYI